MNAIRRTESAVLIAAVALLLAAGAVPAQTVKLAVPTFLTGGGAPTYGVPAKNGVDLVVRAINEGTLPAPYNSVGLAGRKVELLVYDETGGGTKQVTELRNKVQKEGVDVVAGYISSGSCAAIAPGGRGASGPDSAGDMRHAAHLRGAGAGAEVPLPHH